MSYPYLKGHGTENDFVLLPDHDGSVHGGLDPARVVALCDRRAGIGADGVIRVIRTAAVPDAPAGAAASTWFMDYRNADGSVSEMCGNGVRVLARHLIEEGLVDPAGPIPIGTRDGLKTVGVPGDPLTGPLSVDMGTPVVLGTTMVRIAGGTWPARHVDMGNPHAVAFVTPEAFDVERLDPVGFDPGLYPDGVNVEIVVRRGDHVAMRVQERGSGETRSCGTGACAVMVVESEQHWDPELGFGDVTRRVDVPGGTLEITRTEDDRVLLAGPAVIVARGETAL